jgi:adenine specific DNA methylase Mod
MPDKARSCNAELVRRGRINLIYIDPPFDSKADYKKKISLKSASITSDSSVFEEKQYGDMWAGDEYLQFIYERLVLMRELLTENGVIYVHCDHRKSHHIRCILEEVFGAANFMNSLAWGFSTRSSNKATWKRSHHPIIVFRKGGTPVATRPSS